MSFTCVNGVRHKLGDSLRARTAKCWQCDDLTRRASCPHDGQTQPRWAGILGWRHYCSNCGDMRVEYSGWTPEEVGQDRAEAKPVN